MSAAKHSCIWRVLGFLYASLLAGLHVGVFVAHLDLIGVSCFTRLLGFYQGVCFYRLLGFL